MRPAGSSVGTSDSSVRGVPQEQDEVSDTCGGASGETKGDGGGSYDHGDGAAPDS